MNLKYVIPIITNPYNGEQDNIKILAYETDKSSGYNVVAVDYDEMGAVCLKINPGFANLSKDAQRFALLLATAEICYAIGVQNTGIDHAGKFRRRTTTVHAIHRFITLYGTHAMNSVIDELYHSMAYVLSFSDRQDFKDIVNMYVYGTPRDVADRGEKMYALNSAKWNLSDVDTIFVCRDGRFNITTVKYEKF